MTQNTGCLTATCEGVCQTTDLIVSRVETRIHYAVHEAYGDGWNEPREPASVEFSHVVRCDGETPDEALRAWAEAWLALHEDDALAAGKPDPDLLREMQAERRMMERAA